MNIYKLARTTPASRALIAARHAAGCDAWWKVLVSAGGYVELHFGYVGVCSDQWRGVIP
jgi:hypothetical protein